MEVYKMFRIKKITSFIICVNTVCCMMIFSYGSDLSQTDSQSVKKAEKVLKMEDSNKSLSFREKLESDIAHSKSAKEAMDKLPTPLNFIMAMFKLYPSEFYGVCKSYVKNSVNDLPSMITQKTQDTWNWTKEKGKGVYNRTLQAYQSIFSYFLGEKEREKEKKRFSTGQCREGYGPVKRVYANSC